MTISSAKSFGKLVARATYSSSSMCTVPCTAMHALLVKQMCSANNEKKREKRHSWFQLDLNLQPPGPEVTALKSELSHFFSMVMLSFQSDTTINFSLNTYGF